MSDFSNDVSQFTLIFGDKVIFYYGEEHGDTLLETAYYAQSPPLILPRIFPVGNRFVNSMYVSTFGVISFRRPFYRWDSVAFNERDFILEHYLVAPFWSDIDYRSTDSFIYYQIYTRGTTTSHNLLLTEASQLAVLHAGAPDYFTAEAMLVATWSKVNVYGVYYECLYYYYYYYSGSASPCTFDNNTFQAVVVTDYESTYALFGYNCGEMAWSLGSWTPSFNTPSIGFNAGGELFINHQSSRSSTSHNIACLNDPEPLVVVGYKISANPDLDNLIVKCNEWSRADKNENRILIVDPDFPCPCTWLQAIIDRRFRFDFRLYYSALFPPNTWCYVSTLNSFTVRCCYSIDFTFGPNWFNAPLLTEGTQRSSVLAYSPRRNYQLYKQWDEEGYLVCCLDALRCEDYYELRPTPSCEGYTLPTFNRGFGDPHVFTFDELKYTFNGIGEFWMLLPQGDCTLSIQARTQTYKNISASVYTAFTFIVTGCPPASINLLPHAFGEGVDGVALYVNYTNITDQLLANKEYIDNCFDIEYIPANTSNASSTPTNMNIVFKNSATVSVIAEFQLLNMNVSSPTTCKGKTRGLLGQWDDNQSNDLLMRNGSLLNVSATDRMIEMFAESWRITEAESMFYYEPGTGHQFYNPPHNVTVFLDEVVAAANASIVDMCGGDVFCIFDFSQTGNPSIGMATKSISVDQVNNSKIAANNPPRITHPSLFVITPNASSTYTITVTDNEQFTVSYQLSPLDSFSTVMFHHILLTNSTNTSRTYNLILTLISIPSSINLTLTANDSEGASTLNRPVVLLCLCINNGTCLETGFSQDALLMNGYAEMMCNCPIVYEGDRCEIISNQNTLPPIVNSCPSGTTLNQTANRCQDINECLVECNGTNNICNNIYTSYECSCQQGFTLNNSDFSCNDNDECSYSITPCQQLCNNTIGSFSCGCFMNYTLTSDGISCEALDRFPCPSGYNCSNGTCSYTNNIRVCGYCPFGTVFNITLKKCEDINECLINPTICPATTSRCVNKEIGYECACNAGFKSDGQNGCDDIVECLSLTPVCNSTELCVNTIGGFECMSYCYMKGYVVINGTCIIDPALMNATRITTDLEIVVIKFNVSLADLKAVLASQNLTLQDFKIALADAFQSDINDIQFTEKVDQNGLFQLNLESNRFQIDPIHARQLIMFSSNSNITAIVNLISEISDVDTLTIAGTPLDLPILIGVYSALIVLLLLIFIIAVCLIIFLCCSQLFKERKERKLRVDFSEYRKTVKPMFAKLNYSTNLQNSTNSRILTAKTLSLFLAESPPTTIYQEFETVPNIDKNVSLGTDLRIRPSKEQVSANFVRGFKMTQKVYIATEAPNYNNMEDFWKMIWEEKSNCIVMLHEIVERKKILFSPYWPNKDVLKSLSFGNIEVRAETKENHPNYQKATFTLIHSQFKNSHTVTHFWYRNWTSTDSHFIPESLVSFLLATRVFSRSTNSHIVVQCQNGIGRTGVALAVDIGMHELENKGSVDILWIFSTIRQDRGGLIQTKEQYHAVYKCLKVYADFLQKNK